MHVANNPFHAECLRLKKRLADRPDRTMQRRELMRSMTLKANDFDQVIQTLIQQEEIELATVQTKTKSARGYRLIEQTEIRQKSVSNPSVATDGFGP